MDINDVLKFGTRLLIVFMCIPIHEFAHAWAATKMGDDTPRMQGRLTLNPLAHFDLVGGIGILLCGFGWGKPVQVNPMRFNKGKYRSGMAITAAAGPLSNIIMAFLGMIVYKFLWGAYYSNFSDVLYWLMLISIFFVQINLGLAVFNLIPVPPLDGEKILSYFIPDRILAKIEPYQMYISMGILFLIIFTPVLDKPMGAVQNALFTGLDKLTFWIDPIVKAIFFK